MPVTIPGIMGSVIPNLVSTGMIGTGVPQYARGVALGLSQWIPLVKVTTVDAGTAGVGKNVPLPLVVPNPLLQGNLLAGMASQGLVGLMMPLFITGLTNGLVISFAQMLVVTTHPSVGVGAGVAKLVAPPAAASIISGFAQAGMKGDATIRKALALASGLDGTFASLVLPVAIVGPPSPIGSAGSGFGNIL